MHDDDGMDQSDRKLLDNVEKFGWHVVGITPSAEGPAYAFSVGLQHTLRHPEVCIFGLPVKVAQALINEVGRLARQGTPVAVGKPIAGLAEGFDLQFLEVSPLYFQAYFGYAAWFYHSYDFRMLQCVWPDKSGRWPWEPEFTEKFKQVQPVLGGVV